MRGRDNNYSHGGKGKRKIENYRQNQGGSPSAGKIGQDDTRKHLNKKPHKSLGGRYVGGKGGNWKTTKRIKIW